MSIVVCIDGALVAPERARISVFDRGFLYGDSVFETVRTYFGKPFALAEHLARLERSASLVYIPLPVSLQMLEQEMLATVAAASNEESYIRITVTRGQGELGLDPALAEQPTRVIIVGPLSAPPAAAYEHGVSVVTFRTQRPSDNTIAEGAKIGNYLVAVLGVRAARAASAHEALIVTGDDRVVEGASSNVFGIEGGALVTPPVEAGILPGITRDRVLACARELGLEIRLETPTVERLLAMEEIFICSSIRELLPVVRVDSQLVGGGSPGPLTRRLHNGFRDRVRLEMGL